MNARRQFFAVNGISHLGFDVPLITSTISPSNGLLCDGGNHARPFRLLAFPVNIDGCFDDHDQSDKAERKTKHRRYQ